MTVRPINTTRALDAAMHFYLETTGVAREDHWFMATWDPANGGAWKVRAHGYLDKVFEAGQRLCCCGEDDCEYVKEAQ